MSHSNCVSSTDFFVLEHKSFTSQFAYAEVVEPAAFGPGPKCETCGGSIGQAEWLGPYRIRLGSGVRWSAAADIIEGSGIWPFVASERFMSLWRKEGLAGIREWRSVDVEGNASIGKYFLPTLPTPTVKVDMAKIEVDWMREPKCMTCSIGTIWGYRHLAVCINTWAGQDLFELANRPGERLVSPRFEDWARRNEITNCGLIPVAAYVVDHRHRRQSSK